ncbi:MAG: hypothetical protein J5877_01780 [Clostridia bacterium]|nr:hypothetical protein [Clostridia bacterium]
MQKTKKVLAVLLVLVMVLGVLPLTAFAGNGPIDGGGYIGFMLPPYNYDPEIPYMAIVHEGGVDVDPVEGATYDLATNTLTLSDYNMPYSLGISSMGDDFKIELVGENSLDNISISDSQGNGCSVTFTGEGSLTVNENRNADFAISVNACGLSRPTVTFDENVNVTLYALDGTSGGVACVEKALDSDANPEPPVFVFANGQQVNVQKNDTLIFDGEIEGYIIRKMDGSSRWFGKQISNPNDPDGIYTYSEYGHYDPELGEHGEYVAEGYQVERIKEIIEGVYEYDYDYNGEKFETEDALLTAYPPVIAMVTDENPATLNNRLTIATHTSAARIYKDSDDNYFAYSHSWNPDTEEWGDYVCEYSPIPELPGQYVVTPIDGKTLEGLTYTGEDVGAYSLRNDGYPSSCGNIIDKETENGVKYTATLITDETDPDNPHTDWHIFKFVRSDTYDLWFQDYTFNNGEGDIEINPQDFETSEWNAFIYEEREQQVEIKSSYSADSFYGSICEDGEGHCCAIERWADLNDENTVLYDYEDVNGTIIFTENTTFDKANFHVNDGAHVAEGVHDYFIFGQSLTVGAASWAPYVRIVDNEGNRYTPDDVITLKNGEKKFFWCETDFDNNPAHGLTPYVGFSENYEGATLSPAGFIIKDGTGTELGYEGIDSFGIEVEVKDMAVTTEAPLNCWLYEFNGLFPGMEGFDWATMTVRNTFTFTFAVAPNEGWNTFPDGHKEYIENGVNYKSKLATIDGKKYYFDSNGKMVTSKLISVSGKKYYMGKDGAAYKSKLISVDGKKYYIGPDCVAYKSKFASLDGKKYYFGSDCVMVKSKLITVSGKKYYMGKDGVMYKSKLASVSGKKYYFGKDGAAYISKLASVGGKKYYFGSNGAAYMAKLATVSGKKYYFGKDGVAYTSKFASVSGKKYYFGKDGVAYKSKFASISGKKYYFGSDCVMYKSKSFSVSGVKWRAASNGVCKKV